MRRFSACVWRPAVAGTVLGVLALAWGVAPGPARAQVVRTEQVFSIPPQSLTSALIAFSEATGLQLFFDAGPAKSLTSPGASGTMSREEALRRLLNGTGMGYRFTNATTITLEKLAVEGTMMLDPVTVEGASASPATADPLRTEGTRSYAAKAATIGKMPAEIKDIPQSVSVVTQQMIEDWKATDLAQAMKSTTGMTVVRYDGAGIFNEIKARGYLIDTIQQDGVATSQGGGNFATSLDTAVYDRIEVLRGPAGLYQSGGEPGGTINLVRKRALDQWTAGGALSVGSWDAYRSEVDVTGPLVESGRLRGRMVAVADDRGSYQDEVATRKYLGYGTLEADLTPDTTLSVGASRQNIDSVLNHGLTGYADGRLLDVDRSTFIGSSNNTLDTQSQEQFLELRQRLAAGGEAQMSVRHMNRWMLYKAARANGTVSNAGDVAYQTVLNETGREEWSLDAHLSQPVEVGGLVHTVLLGVDYRTQQDDLGYGYGATGTFNVASRNHAFGNLDIPITTRTHTETEQYGSYGQMRIKPGLDWVTLVGGGRLSWWNTEELNAMTNGVNARNSVRGTFTPYGGVVVEATPQVSLYASYSEIFKPQTNQDTSGKILDPRIGYSTEIGAKGAFLDNALNTHLALYQMFDENRATAIANCTGTRCYEASGRVRSRGLEAQVSGTPWPHWDVSAGYAYVLTDTVEGTPLGQTFATETPKHSATLMAKYTITGGALDGLSLGGGVKAVSSFYSQSNAIRWIQDGYAVVNAMIGYDLAEDVDLSLNVNNLFDSKYYEKLSSGRQFYYGDPLNAMLTLRMKW